ncbi:MAG: MlaE family lipid ABC transporter permease subunit [Alphaproteobacteria bacterium]|nr:MlaE family lipid ABC transporter permease subunit [Alphaproteobacteria bacterium]
MLTTIPNPAANIGRATLGFLADVGRLAVFLARSVGAIFSPPFYFGNQLRQMLSVGYYSLPVVGLTALFTGAVLAQQIYIGTGRFDAESTVPTIVVFGITRELGPVIASLMVAGRVSAAMAAELGTMRVTEQIDALTTLATNPFRYLIAPRILAATLMMPLLVLISDIIGVMGGWLLSTTVLNYNSIGYLQRSLDFMETWDVVSGLIKAGIFGFILSLMGCYQGFNSSGGAQGVGRATTNAVVSASILILAANYAVTSIVFTD